MILKEDENSRGGEYAVTSLYFDNLYNSAYREKVEGDNNRHKFRIRFYNEDRENFKLEKKSKRGVMTLKSNTDISKEDVELLLKSEYEFLKDRDGTVFHELYDEMKNKLLRPKVIVRYIREAYTHRIGDTRVTFDKEISTANNSIKLNNVDTLYLPILERNTVVMEIKFNGIYPEVLRELIQSANSAQTAVSKYVLARKYNLES